MTGSIRLLLLAMSLALALSSCATYKITAIEDHPALPLTRIEALKTVNYLVWATHSEQFYLCKDNDNSVDCQLQCDGGNDIKCPPAVFFK